jgi:hypothetical protein
MEWNFGFIRITTTPVLFEEINVIYSNIINLIVKGERIKEQETREH